MSDNPRLMKAKLSQSGIHCTLDWVTACLDWLAGEQPGLSSSQVVLKLQEQWLITDITRMCQMMGEGDLLLLVNQL